MRINNNLMAMNTHRQLGINNTATSKSLEKLSSGFKINRAGDDAAGLAISEKMRGQIRGLNMASKNAQDGISLIQTAEGGLNETHAILQRMRELAVQSANDTNVKVDRGEIQKEIDQLSKEITRIADTTEFNTQNLLGGKFKGTFHIGANEGQNIELSINKMDAGALEVAGVAGASFDIAGTAATSGGKLDDGVYDVLQLDEGTKVKDKAGTGTIAANYALVNKDGKIAAVSADGKDYVKLTAPVTLDKISDGQSAHDTDMTKFGDAVVNGKVTVSGTGTNITAKATVTDTKLANDTYTVATGTFAGGATLGLKNSKGDIVAVGTDGKVWKNMAGETVLTTATANNTGGKEITVGSDGGLNVSTQKFADKAITTINKAIETVSAERSKLGAMQNRLEHTIKNLDTSAENLQAAESRIRDVDMAKEMMEFTKQNILQQAATAMLAQANQAPQTVLQLLR